MRNQVILNNKRQVKALSVITLILLTISTLSLIYNIYAYFEIKAKTPEIDVIGIGVAIGYIPKTFLYFSFGFLILSILNILNKFKLLGISGVILGVVSAISLVGEYAALTDILDDYVVYGYKCTLEWITVYLGTIIHILFYFFVFFILLKTLKILKTPEPVNSSVVNEIFFEIIHYIGAICGLIGLAFTTYVLIFLTEFQIYEMNWLKWLILVYCLIIVLPYCAVILFFIIKIIRTKKRTRYDEKQKNNLIKAGFTAWIFSIPVLLLFFIINLIINGSSFSILWLILYFFLNLFLFSFATLIYYKKDL